MAQADAPTHVLTNAMTNAMIVRDFVDEVITRGSRGAFWQTGQARFFACSA